MGKCAWTRCHGLQHLSLPELLPHASSPAPLLPGPTPAAQDGAILGAPDEAVANSTAGNLTEYSLLTGSDPAALSTRRYESLSRYEGTPVGGARRLLQDAQQAAATAAGVASSLLEAGYACVCGAAVATSLAAAVAAAYRKAGRARSAAAADCDAERAESRVMLGSSRPCHHHL